MSSFFIFNNILFAVEIFGALAFLVVAWLAFDAFLLRKDFKTATRFIGFGLLAAWQVLFAFNQNTDFGGYTAYFLRFLGLFFVIVNAVWEWPVKAPKFRGMVALPVFGAILPQLNIATTVGLSIIAVLGLRQQIMENKQSLRFYWIGF